MLSRILRPPSRSPPGFQRQKTVAKKRNSFAGDRQQQPALRGEKEERETEVAVPDEGAALCARSLMSAMREANPAMDEANRQGRELRGAKCWKMQRLCVGENSQLLPPAFVKLELAR